ncbi:Heptahelical 4 isoform 2 [Micractinium conductrix]|uniref:Heptahelical 4 isoform 2 n=1 Tax=Micractinium conductrix TaxID=554055 RepID=A0A2P6VMQ5_9CHLO|nr:Heptahelical 4 isoform 2 [Micractinium conductrix]|eukprot:PSC75369.1 Heptahelical 4 isoform 2 [Micractinium conductrix]
MPAPAGAAALRWRGAQQPAAAADADGGSWEAFEAIAAAAAFDYPSTSSSGSDSYSSSDSDSAPAQVGAAAAAHDAAVAAVAGTAGGAPPRRPARQRAASLLPYELTPEHYRDNVYIHHWYRPPGGFRKSLASLFRLHNETGNVWTHLLGFIIFIFLTAATVHLKPAPLRLGADALAHLEHKLVTYGKSNLLELVQAVESWEHRVVSFTGSQLGALEDRLSAIGRHNLQELLQLSDAVRAAGQTGWQELSGVGEKISAEISNLESAVQSALATALEAKWPVSRWPIYVFTAGAMICLLTSAVCHLFGCCAAHVTAVMWRFDYAGIAVLIVASFFPPVHFGFLCAPHLRLFYLATTTLLGLCTLCVTLMSAFQRPEFQTYRALLFVSLGLWGIVPMLHGWFLNGGQPEVTRALLLDLLMGAIYIGGAVVYAARFPERLKPGAFDVAFHSHQLFHVAVVIAALIHYKAVRILLAWRDASGGCALSGPPPPLAAPLAA